MAEQVITIKKGKHIIDNLQVINKHMNQILGRVIDPPLVKYMRSFTQQELKPYPPVPTHSTYVRTRELFRGWDVLVSRRDLWVKTVNTAKKKGVNYPKYVVGEGQVWYHDATGWPFLPDEGISARQGAVPVASRALESEIAKFLFTKGLR